MKAIMPFLQRIGRALMLPIAVLPVAGLLLRLGQPDLFDIAFMSAAGDAIFANLGLLFAIGVATGFARDGHGSAALAALVCYLIATKGAEVLLQLPPAGPGAPAPGADAATIAQLKAASIARLSVPIGILAGLTGGLTYNRFSGILLPDYLAFFGGKRFVSLISGLMGLALAAMVGSTYSALNAGLDHIGAATTASGAWGLFAYGVINRLLIVTGLHHIINNICWFVIGDYGGVTGDLRRFFAGDPTAGGFMTGFFPVMMFGLPAACLAMYRSIEPARRKAAAGMFLSMGLTSFLTGVTEPVEFSFMFVAPILYVLHAILTGISMALADILGIKIGFTFSAGLFDYAINFNKSQNPLYIIPIGAIYFALYYFSFRFVIAKLDLKTPGRDQAAVEAGAGPERDGEASDSLLAALGGGANLRSIGSCTTRLRLDLFDPGKVDEPTLRRLGVLGIVRPSAASIQLVVGPKAEIIADDMRERSKLADVRHAHHNVRQEQNLEEISDEIVQSFGGKENISFYKKIDGRILLRLIEMKYFTSNENFSKKIGSIFKSSNGLFHIILK